MKCVKEVMRRRDLRRLFQMPEASGYKMSLLRVDGSCGKALGKLGRKKPAEPECGDRQQRDSLGSKNKLAAGVDGPSPATFPCLWLVSTHVPNTVTFVSG